MYEPAIIYTGAPQAADYDYTVELEVFQHSTFTGDAPRTWRKVKITADSYHTAYQCDRYGSFIGGCPTMDDPRTHLVGTGRPAPTNYQ